MYSIMASNLIFFGVWFGVNRRVFPPFGPSSSPFNSLVMLLIYSTFLQCFLGCHILVQNCSVSLASLVGMFSYHLPQLVGRIFFRYFEMSYFVCRVLPFLIFLLCKFFTPTLVDGFFLESEWTASLFRSPDSSQCSNRSQQSNSLDSLDFFL